MSDLVFQQRLMLDALFVRPADSVLQALEASVQDPGGRGFKVYQANGHTLALRGLQSAYPIVEQLLGQESFADLARALWHAQPPQRGDIAQWGDALADFLQTSVQVQDEGYLPDVARVEWALHRCAQASDAVAELTSLEYLTTREPEQLRLVLAPGTSVLRSAWPVASIVGAHVEGSPTLQEAAAQLRAGVQQDVVVWRQGLRPRMREALPHEYEYLQVLLRGDPLAAALEGACGLDFAQWLPMAVSSGLLLAVAAVDA